jgi:peptidyl-prolyl cis-trans isomerase SurA
MGSPQISRFRRVALALAIAVVACVSHRASAMLVDKIADEYFELMRIGLSKRNLLNGEIRSRVNVSDDDVRNYYFNMAMKNSSIPLEYSLQLIVVSPKTYKTPRDAQAAAEEALRSIKQGEPFAEVAKRLSDDPSAQNGGDLGYVAGEQLAEPLRSAVRKLQIGALSDVLKGPNGYMIVKLVDAKSAESQKFNEAKEQIREQLAKEEYKKQLVIWAERARNSAYVHVN